MLRPTPVLLFVALLAGCFSEENTSGDGVASAADTSATGSPATMSTLATTADDNTGDASASMTGTASTVTDDPVETTGETTEQGSSGSASSTGEPPVEPLHCAECMFFDIEYDHARDACACAPRCPDGICEGGLNCIDGYCGVPCDGDGAECSGDMICGFMNNLEFACMHPGEQPYVFDEHHCGGDCAEADKVFGPPEFPACFCANPCESDNDCAFPAMCTDTPSGGSVCAIECEGSGDGYCPNNVDPPLGCVLYELPDLQICMWHLES